MSLAQVHAALVYYYDHQQALDDEIAARVRKVDEIKSRRQDSTVRDKLRAAKRLP